MLRNEIHVEASPGRVFAVLADSDRYDTWVVGAGDIRRSDPDFPRPGSSFDHTLRLIVPIVRDRTEVRSVDPPRTLELAAHAGWFHAQVRFELEPNATGTTVAMEEDGLDGFSRLMVRAGRPLVLARNAETLWRLKAQVENDGDVSAAARRRTETRTAVPRWLSDVTARIFGLATALRGGRVFHAHGVVRTGSAELAGRGRVLTSVAEAAVVMRFSRGLGMPSGLPDINGLAIRFLNGAGDGRHRDILLASVGSGALRRVLFPTGDFTSSSFSSILRYRLEGEPVVLTASVDGCDLSLARLADGAPARIELRAEHGRTKELLATIDVGDIVLDQEIRFDPTSADGHLVALGFLNTLRAPAYTASQAIVELGHTGRTRDPSI